MKKERLLSAILAFLLVFTAFTPAFAVVDKPTKDIYCVDEAGVLSDDTKSYILSAAESLDSKTTCQVVVVTVEYLDGMYADDYAKKVLNTWGVGSSTDNNGVVILMCPNEGKFWVVQGQGLEKILTDEKIGEILDSKMESSFDNGNYDKAAKDTFDAVSDYLTKNYNNGNGSQTDPNNGQNNGSKKESGPRTFVLFVAIVLFLLYVLTPSRKTNYTRRKYYYNGNRRRTATRRTARRTYTPSYPTAPQPRQTQRRQYVSRNNSYNRYDNGSHLTPNSNVRPTYHGQRQPQNPGRPNEYGRPNQNQTRPNDYNRPNQVNKNTNGNGYNRPNSNVTNAPSKNATPQNLTKPNSNTQNPSVPSKNNNGNGGKLGGGSTRGGGSGRR